MSQYYLFQDSKKCIGCHACEIQCKTNKDLPEGPKLCQIIQVGPKFINNLPKMSFIFMPCFHCENPWCVSACPTGAMQQRSSDGIVFVRVCTKRSVRRVQNLCVRLSVGCTPVESGHRESGKM